MENLWQRKLGSFWRQPYPPPPPPPLVASSLLDSLAQLSSADCRLYMQLLQEPMPLTGGVAQGQMLSNMHGLENLGPTELGASFLSLISGPMAHVPCDQQHLLDPTTIPVSNVLPPIRRTAHVFSGESRVPILPGVSWPHNMDRPNVSPREIFLPYTPPSINVNCNDSEVLQAASLYVRKSQTVSYQNPLEKDNVNCFYPSVGCNSSSRKLEKYPHITASNSFPRVSCYGMSGSLLLSDTRLLGVVCTCHGLYMSISKFSEHSGACDVDPGNAVCMDDGETVAHWWKAFSSRTKIRVLERHRGWDWPEEISVASSLTNHPVSSLSNNPILLNQVGSFSASASHEKKNYSVMDSKHNHSCRNIVDEYLCHGRDSPSRECSNSVSKCFMNNSHENLPYAVGQQIRGQPNSFYVHSEKASKSVAPTPHIICENENALPALPNLQDLKSSCNGFSDGTNNNFCVERPGVPSSIELRLGQPPEKSLTSDAKHQLSMGSKLNGAYEEPSTVFFQDKLPQTSNVWQGIGLTLQYADMYSSPIERRGPAELDHSRDGGGAYGTTTTCCKDSPNISLEATNINSKLLPFFRNLDMKCQFRNIYENSIDRHAGEQMRYESNASERHRIYLPWNSLAGTVKECGMDVPTAPSNMNGDEEVECALNGLVGEAKLNDEVPREYNGNARRSNLVFGENSTDFQVKSLDSHYRSGTAKRLLQSKLNTNCSFLKETAKSFHKAEKRAESCSFQWRDVPKNGTGNHSLAKKEQEAVSCSPLMCPSADVATFFAGFAPTVVPLKEHEVFNISSRCSAPDVTQSSSEVNKKDSSTTEVKNASFADSLVVDKGSGNVRSCSSDDAIDSELYGSGSKISLIKREPFELVPRKQSLSLIEEIRLQNSLQSKMIPQKIKRSYTFHEDSESLQKFELTPTKKRKTIKWMKLDVSGHSSIHNRSIKCFEEVGQNSNSFSDMQMKIKCDRGRPRYCADSVEKSDKQRNSAFSVAKWVSHGKDFKEFYHREEQKQTNAHNISVVDYALRASKMFRKKRLRSNDASARPTEVGEKHCSAKLTENLTSEAGSSKTLKKVRPTVCGMYGIISNGNPSKSTKIIPLSVVLRTAGSLADKSNRKTDNYKKLKSTTVKEKNMSVRHVDDTALGKKVPKSRLRKCGTHSSQPIELESSVWNDELDTASCSETNGSDCPSCALQKCSNHGITDRKPEDNLKTKFKEGRKRSLYELLFKGNCSEVVSSSFMKNSSVCKTAGRCCKEVMEIAMDSRAQTSETSKAVRCSVKHLPENSDMFCCVCGGSDKDERNQLLQCNRFLLKGLQDEAEAVCNENVSFCQRCIPHATSHMRIPDSDSGYLQPGEKVSCARTEGYKGRKREGFLHNNSRDTNRSGGCLIPQEQLNAWLHIHRQRPQRKDRPKLSTCIVESDCRKAYTRYKQSKNWKHLVVYKSGIHALGLYTSQFISQGAMVVEYVGEIVGLRVADRRESEYHAGKKLQHKSACYFFRIDKENIIDATRKGGIARFVNHSCQPNCVAKVISVRTEKKVVFFAERDIYPGEEITYDYHFNHEDEGEKIPCYCNSRNCRRYLN